MDSRRLTDEYRLKSDEELLELASHADQLTPDAHFVLRGELAKRRIDGENLFRATEATTGRTNSCTASAVGHSDSVEQFVGDVLRLYRRNFRLFIKLIAPAVVVGYIAVLLARMEAHEIASHVPRGIEFARHHTEVAKILIINLSGYFISWMAFCFSFGAISTGVLELGRETIRLQSASALLSPGSELGHFCAFRRSCSHCSRLRRERQASPSQVLHGS